MVPLANAALQKSTTARCQPQSSCCNLTSERLSAESTSKPRSLPPFSTKQSHSLPGEKHPLNLKKAVLKMDATSTQRFQLQLLCRCHVLKVVATLERIQWVLLSSPHSHSPKLRLRKFAQVPTNAVFVHRLTGSIIA